ncbi:hypothetical protein JIY74_33540 [Vibrio harveyi]|nr:hypothetical protein [Vibrio harveyi]
MSQMFADAEAFDQNIGN